MIPRRRSGSPLNRAIVDCAYCPTARRCWEERPQPGAGFLVQPEQRLERGAALTLPVGASGVAFVLVSGCLTLRETISDGSQRTAGFRLPGELVGLENWGRAANRYEIRAASSSVVCRLALTHSGHGGSQRALLERLLVKSAAQIDQAMRPWVGLPAVERVAAFVEDFVQRAQVRGASPGRLRLPMTRADIGSFLGLAEETVVRALAKLKQARRLEVRGKMVRLCRPANS